MIQMLQRLVVLLLVWVAPVTKHLSEGEREAGAPVQQAALHPVSLAVGDVVLPAVARRPSHDQQGPRRQQAPRRA